MFLYVHHVHYLVNDFDEMVEYFEKTFDMKPTRKKISAKKKEALYNIGQTQLQITASLDPTHAWAKHLAKHGPGVYHVAWGVSNLRKKAEEIVAKGNKSKLGIIDSSKTGSLLFNIDRDSSHGVYFQLAEGDACAEPPLNPVAHQRSD